MSNRLARLLLVVPTAARQEGVAIEELARQLQCTVEELRSDIDLLACVGAPPYNPDDLIEIEESDGRVYVHFAQAFERQIRLSATEAVALTLAGQALAPQAPGLQAALAKLRRGIAPDQQPLFEGLLRHLGATLAEPADEVVGTLDEGAKTRRVVEMKYFSGTERMAGSRRVSPRTILNVDGRAYLSARNEAGDERTYRIDRIAQAFMTDESFEALPPIDFVEVVAKLRGFAAHRDLPRATVRYAPSVAEAARVRHDSGKTLEDGSFEATVGWASMPWLVSYVLSWGGKAVVVQPEEARRAVRQALEEMRRHLIVTGDGDGIDARESSGA